ERGFWNPQFLMIASAVIEWIMQNFYRDLGGRRYESIIEEARSVPPGSEGIIFIPSFVSESGPLRKYNVLGSIIGLNLGSTRAQIIRAAFEGLTFQMREALRILSEAMGVKADKIYVVGGGSRNDLWNQMRADATGLHVVVPRGREAAPIGAALISLVGLGYYRSIDEARKNFFGEEKIFTPVLENKSVYDSIFGKYLEVLERLK
ncbi:MAG: FGGY-family carbohydrate kinase, partial [Candidatus Bathyarchaeia archaeon]